MNAISLYRGVVVMLMFASCHSLQRADLIVYHGHVYTVDSVFSEAEAFAVKDGKILDVGTDREIADRYVADSVKDAAGKAVYPGFIDAHAHFLAYGHSLFTVDLFGSASFDEVVARVKRFSNEHPGDISPFKTFLAAVFRVDDKGRPAGGFQPENALTWEGTIRGMTIWAAKADFIVLDRDLMKVPQTDVLSTKVVEIYSGGRRVYQSGDTAAGLKVLGR